MHHASEYKLNRITGQRLFDLFATIPDTAGGMDGFGPSDMRLLSPHACDLLADLLHLIEQGAPWPDDLSKARAAYLAKDTQNLDDCANYRVLMIMLVVYRAWAKIRLEDLQPWIQTWSTEEILAGTTNNGAEDAWWQSSIFFENATLQGKDYTGGAADIYKCFDQVLRQLLVDMLEQGGMDKSIICAYSRYMDGLTVYNSVANSLGAPHKLPTGIPQGGCPLSMMLIAFLLKPWITATKQMGAKPRILADDIMVYAIGEGHEETFRRASDLTHEYVADIGAKLAPAKSYTFSNNKKTRQRLRQHQWQHTNSTIKVVIHGRDLGTHLNTGHVMVGTTLTNRMLQAITTTNRTKHLPNTYQQKAHLIRPLVLPKALYGCESAPVCERTLQKLRSAIADAIAPHSGCKSIEQTVLLSSHGKDLDPTTHILRRRATMLRRMQVKHPEIMPIAPSAYNIYKNNNFAATKYDNKSLAKASPAPPPGHPDRKQHRMGYNPRGPMGLLLMSLHMVGAALSPDHTIHTHNETPIHIHDTPWQHFQEEMQDLATRARYNHTRTTRSLLKDTNSELDTHMITHALRTLGTEAQQWVTNILRLARWTESKLTGFQQDNDGMCSLCNETPGTLKHMLWECKCLNAARYDEDPELEKLDHECLPDNWQIGLPGALHPNDDPYLWDTSNNPITTKLPTYATYNKSRHPQAKQLVQEMTLQHHEYNARQLIQVSKTADWHDELPMPEACYEMAPEKVNVYNDGSLKHPTIQFRYGDA